MNDLLNASAKRLRRMQRRRSVARAYDMAIEIARVIPQGSRVLDFGCGNGFIAHHLSSILHAPVVGLDVRNESKTPIEFVMFNGRRLPFEDNSFDVILFCYVLHHVRDAISVLKEACRVLREGGRVVVYEDIPRRWWDRQFCKTHDLRWRSRTGPCTFFQDQHWRRRFELANLQLVSERRLSRWRNVGHPVSRQFYLLTKRASPTAADANWTLPRNVTDFGPGARVTAHLNGPIV